MLVLCDIVFRRMCIRICHVHFCCQPTPQPQNYSSLWTMTYQGTELVILCRYKHRAAAMTEWLSGFTTRIKEVTSEYESMYCITHREMLANWKMSSELNDALQDAIKIIKHTEGRALNSRLSVQLCEETDAEHTHLLLHTEVRWFARGRSLARVSELREPPQRFLLEK